MVPAAATTPTVVPTPADTETPVVTETPTITATTPTVAVTGPASGTAGVPILITGQIANPDGIGIDGGTAGIYQDASCTMLVIGTDAAIDSNGLVTGTVTTDASGPLFAGITVTFTDLGPISDCQPITVDEAASPSASALASASASPSASAAPVASTAGGTETGGASGNATGGTTSTTIGTGTSAPTLPNTGAGVGGGGAAMTWALLALLSVVGVIAAGLCLRRRTS